MGHPISSDNGLISQKLSSKSELHYPLHVALVWPTPVWNMKFFLSQPDLSLMIYKFVYITMRARGRENQVVNRFLCRMVLVRDVVRFFGKSYSNLN